MRKRTVATVALPAILWAIFVGHATAHAANVSLGKPVTGVFFNDVGNSFPPGNITDGRFDDTGSPDNRSFWLGPNWSGNVILTIDLQADYLINALELQDSHNAFYFDRGTNAFAVRVSSDNVNYTTVVNDSFSDSDWRNLTIRHFDVPSVAGRFVQFEVLSVYSSVSSAGLNELTVFGSASSAVPEIDPAGAGSVLAIVAGAFGVSERRRRQVA